MMYKERFCIFSIETVKLIAGPNRRVGRRKRYLIIVRTLVSYCVKEEAEKEAEVTRRSTQETSISRRGGRGVSAPRPSRGTSISRGGSMINRGGGAFARGGGRGGRSTLPTVENSAPSVSQAENSSATAYEEIDWVSCLTTSNVFYSIYAQHFTGGCVLELAF